MRLWWGADLRLIARIVRISVPHELAEGSGFAALADQPSDKGLERLTGGGTVVDGDLEFLAADGDLIRVLAEGDSRCGAAAIEAIGCAAPGTDLAEVWFAPLPIAV